MSHNLPRTHNVYHVEEIDATKCGSTMILEVGGQDFYPSLCIVELISSNALSSVPKISIGSFNSNFEDIIPATQLTGLMTANMHIKYHFSGVMKTLKSGAKVGLNIIEAATGGSGLEYKIKIILSGAHV